MVLVGRNGGCNFREIEELKKRLDKVDAELNSFIEECTKEIAARLLRKVVKRTPVGDYSKEIEVVASRDSKKHKKGEIYKKRVNPSGLMGGTLKRGWTQETFVVHHYGDTYVITITNNTEYASYVEFGHRTRGGKGWVKGKFMLTISEEEMQKDAPKILENKIKKWLSEEIRND